MINKYGQKVLFALLYSLEFKNTQYYLLWELTRMAVVNIFSHPNDGQVSSYGSTDWATSRDAGTGTNAAPTEDESTYAIVGAFETGRGGGTWSARRSFFSFDTSVISSSFSVTSAVLFLYGASNPGGYTEGDVLAVKSTWAPGSAIAVADFDAIDGFSAGNSMAGNVTDLTDVFPSGSWNDAAYNALTANAAGREEIRIRDDYTIAVVNYTHDYLNRDPDLFSDAAEGNGIFFTDESGTDKDPHIRVTYTIPYGNNVAGVESADIGKIAGVATTSVDKVLGVDD